MSAEKNQIALFDITEAPDPRDIHGSPDLDSYDYVVVMMSGGKDSQACLLNLLEQGVPRSKIELWHHRVDGGFEEARVWDWPVTDAYLKALAEAFDVPLLFSWKHRGITGEMLRENSLTQPTSYELPNGQVMTSGGVRGQISTRRMFPAISADLKKRFCSSVAKIDVGAMAITGQTRFCGKRTLVITGERAEESSNRSRYLRFEPHRTDRREGKLARHVDHWRPVLDWSEQEVWDIIARWGVRVFRSCQSLCQLCLLPFLYFRQPGSIRHPEADRSGRLRPTGVFRGRHEAYDEKWDDPLRVRRQGHPLRGSDT